MHANNQTRGSSNPYSYWCTRQSMQQSIRYMVSSRFWEGLQGAWQELPPQLQTSHLSPEGMLFGSCG